MPYRLLSLLLILSVATVWGARWEPTVTNTPDLHTTALSLRITLSDGSRVSAAVVDLTCMDKTVWRARAPLPEGRIAKVRLTADDFSAMAEPKAHNPLRLGYVTSMQVTADGVSDTGIESISVKWLGNDGVVYPWEREPAQVVTKGGRMWPGLHRNNAGHFGWRWEPAGLLVNNVAFDYLTRSWYYFKPGRKPNENYRVSFGVPDGKIVPLREEPQADKAKAAEGDEGPPANAAHEDALDADWTHVRRRRGVLLGDKRYYQELRYSALGVGFQVETDAPAFAVSFQDRGKAIAPAGIVLPTQEGPRLIASSDGLNPGDMAENWLLLLANDGSPEIPLLVVFSRRPDAIDWSADGLVIRRKEGVGTLGLGTPFGVRPLSATCLADWQADPSLLPAAQARKVAGLIARYPWRCRELFSVKGQWVTIRNEIEFLDWEDDWGTAPAEYAPLPPLVPYCVERGYLPAECVAEVNDLKIPTKWGPYWARAGSSIEYRLPIPDPWDYAPLAITGRDEDPALKKILDTSLSDEAVERLKTDRPTPAYYPHYVAHDFTAGGWRAANFMAPEVRQKLRDYTRVRVLRALFPQNYRLRRDPVTGATYLGCTFVWGRSDPPNSEGAADIDYWQGITLYGLYTHAKYAADWNAMRGHWPLIRSLMSYWESANSWALMGPGAREAGELFGGDMPTAGFAGLLGFHRMAKVLGSAYERDMAAYLLAKSAVPMVCKFGFREWCSKMLHQELYYSKGQSTGLGEMYAASFPLIKPHVKDIGSGSIWWQTGCIGPQGAQPEILDLLMQTSPADMLRFEKSIMAACPDETLRTHNEMMVPPHIALRTQLGGTMRDSADWLARKWRSVWMLRDVHTLAGLAAWDVPVRLVDWTPAYLKSGQWDSDTRTATMAFEVSGSSATVQWAARAELRQVTLDGRAIEPKLISKPNEWSLYETRLPRGRHELRVRTGRQAVGWGGYPSIR